MLKDDFPKIWVPSWENRDLRQLLWHRHRMVQARTRLMNQLQAVALKEGLRCKRRLWREKGRKQLEAIRLGLWASRRREDLLKLLDELNPTIAELTRGSGEVCRSKSSAHTSWRWSVNRPRLRIDHRESSAISMRQAGGSVFGVSALRGFQWRTPSARTYHQARELADALLAGGVGSDGGTKYSAMAKPVHPSGDAAGTKDRQSGPGPKAGHSLVLDDASGMGLRADDKVRFARRTARKLQWCVVEHRAIDWASCSSLLIGRPAPLYGRSLK